MQVTIKVELFKWMLNQELLLGFTTLLFVLRQVQFKVLQFE